MRTINSDCTPFWWALVYSTTPSFPVVGSLSPLTAMMEWVLTPGATGISDRTMSNGFCGDMLSILVGVLSRNLLGSFDCSKRLP
ncbi:MAG: hypothetical protein ACYSWS_08140 [Planctomycetota bacterium]